MSIRRPWWIVLVLAAVIGVGGHHSSQAQTSGAPPASGATTSKASFMVFGDTAELRIYRELVSAFQTNVPAIEVELIPVPQSGYRRRMNADFAAGTPADLILLNYRRYASSAARGQLAPLGDFLASSQLVSERDFYPQALAPFRWQGKLMCIPQNLSSLVVYYNKRLFDEAKLSYPGDTWTWDDFLKAAKALTRDTNGDGRMDQYGLGTEISILRVAPFIWSHGGELVDNYSSPTRLTIDWLESMEAIRWFVDLGVRHRVTPMEAEEKALDSETRFKNGTTAMFLNSRRGVPAYRGITLFDWDVAALPRSKKPAGILHSDAYCMPSAAKNKDGIWKFIEYANSPEGQAVMARTGRTVPSLPAVAKSPDFLDPQAQPRNSRVFLDTLPYIRAVPIHRNWAEVEDAVDKQLERAFYGAVSVEEAVKAAIAGTAKLFP
jgi:multiple sugar transport system substrate-binding protein